MASRVLQLLVRNSWVADNLRSLGPGKMYHLAYRTVDMAPDVLEDMATGQVAAGVPAEVALLVGAGEAIPVADVTIEGVHDFVSYCRFDFRILRLHPRPAEVGSPGFMCRYVEK
ncbi:MAG TPA: hypothetical protein VIK73_04265 [Limnochordales bacterium]